MSLRNVLLAFTGLAVVGAVALFAILTKYSNDLPTMIALSDYKPLLVSEVYDRNGKKLGEFFREKRILIPYKEIPENVINAFIAAEDDTFFKHEGVNYVAIARAFFANIRSGKKSQGGSTITQQVARSLLLSSEKTYTRKIKEIMLARKMEESLSKEDILYLYLNQIYLGQGAHGVGAAAQIYFRKDVRALTIPEAAILAGLPQAPSRYSPIKNPASAKERQRYVLHRMGEVGFITRDEAERLTNEPVKLFVWENFKDLAPFYLETLRQALIAEIGEEMVLDKGIKVHTGLDLVKQVKAQEHVQNGLRALDKRQGYRGPIRNLGDDSKLIAEFLLQTRNSLMDESSPERILKPDGTFEPRGPLNLTGKDTEGKDLPNLPDYVALGKIVEGVVTKVDDATGLTYVRFGESRGLVDLETMEWARKPDPNVKTDEAKVKKPSLVLKVGDVILLKVSAKEFKSERLAGPAGAKLTLPDFKQYALVELEQEPKVEGALLAIDEKTSDVISLVGGYDFARSKFNRSLQAIRQTGSSFKALVYLAALDKGYTPATPIIDAPIVFDEPTEEGQDNASKGKGKDKEEEVKIWRPKNDSNKFGGDILFRNALIRSLNIPTVKIIEKIGVDWAATYARRLGIFSPLNMDFTLALGSSGVTLYEMTRAFGIVGRQGQFLSPILVRKVLDAQGTEILTNVTIDQRFKTELSRIETDFEERREKFLKDPEAAPNTPPLYFTDKNLVLRPQTAYVLTTILQGTIDESGGTGGAARALGRPVAGKTGTTNGYFDAWFVGYTPDVVTGVWVGFDEEKSIGRGEVGAKAALPIWLDYMKVAHEGLPPRGFPVPDGVVFANIDNQTGRLVSSSSKLVVRQAFIDGTEPGSEANPEAPETDTNFYKEDMSD